MDRREFARPWWLLPLRRIHPLWWGAIGVGLIWIDYAAGPSTQFPVFYVIPVSLAAWYSGRRPALALAVVVPLVHVIFQVALWKPPGELPAIATTIFRGAVIVVMALWFARLSEHERALHRYVLKLEGMLRVCSYCKSIRNETGKWEPFDTFISGRSDAQFSHGFCPTCVERHYADSSPGEATPY
jgi:hypothetical protein